MRNAETGERVATRLYTILHCAATTRNGDLRALASFAFKYCRIVTFSRPLITKKHNKEKTEKQEKHKHKSRQKTGRAFLHKVPII